MIYICIPAHNEERTIGVLLWKIRQVLADFPRDYQILVANDGSTDGTSDVLAPYQRVLPLTVFQSHKQRGYTTSLEQLIREAVRRAEYPKRDVIVTLQADFTDDPDDITAMMKRIEAGADLVCVNSELLENASRAHRWGRRISGYLVNRKKWPEGVSDPTCGYRAYRVMTVKRALDGTNGKRLLSWHGALANAELLQLVMPHSRRTDAIEAKARSDRQQRPSRHLLWPAVKAMFGFARGAAGPLAESALEPTENVEDHRNRKRGIAQLRHEYGSREAAERPAGRGRPRAGAGRGEGSRGRPRPDGERRPNRSERPARAEGERPARAPREGPARERPPRGEKQPRAERPPREKQPRAERPPRERPAREPQEAVSADETLLPVDGIVPVGGDAAAPKKKRRRRRRKSGTGSESGSVNNGSPTEVLEGEAGDQGATDSSEEGASDGGSQEAGDATTGDAPAGEVKRRRRSRRGRGRRRGRRPEGSSDESASIEGMPEGGSAPADHDSGPAPAPPETGMMLRDEE